MRERVTVQSVTETKSSTGFPAESWVTYATRWAGVEYKSGSEAESAGAKTAETTAVFRLRYDKAINQKHRIFYASMAWDIREIVISPLRDYMDIKCVTNGDYVTVTENLKLATATLSVVSGLSSSLKLVKQVSANLTVLSSIDATAESGNVIHFAEANLTADLSLTAIGKMARNIVANISAGGTVDSASQLSLPALAELAAMSSVESAGQIAKISEAILSATATLSALAESQAQGVAYASALLTAQGNLSAALSISKQLIASLNAGGNIQAAGLVARMASAALEANAQLLAVAQSVKVAQADLTAVAETQLDAVVSRAVTAQLNAIAQTDLNAIISRSLSASMSATANTSVTAVLANQCVALLSASGSLSATLKRAVSTSATLSASATVSATGTAQAASDPYWANVELLAHANSLLTDSSGNSTLSFSGTPTPTYSTSIKQYGSASFNFSSNTPASTGGFVSISNSDLLSLNNSTYYTVEMWVYPTALQAAGIAVIFGEWGSSVATRGYALVMTNTQLLQFRYVDTNSTTVAPSTSATISLNTWSHVALVKDGSNIYIFINGVQYLNTTISTVKTSGLSTLTLGAANAGLTSFSGYIDEVRVTKGVARYTANFTPPTAEFPNS